MRKPEIRKKTMKSCFVVEMRTTIVHRYWPGADSAKGAIEETQQRLKDFGEIERGRMGAVLALKTEIVNVVRNPSPPPKFKPAKNATRQKLRRRDWIAAAYRKMIQLWPPELDASGRTVKLYKAHQREYAKSLADTYYADGVSPEDALAEDLSYA